MTPNKLAAMGEGVLLILLSMTNIFKSTEIQSLIPTPYIIEKVALH